MRKPIKPAVICEHCGTTLTPREEACFCDNCKNKIPEDISLHISVFWKGDDDLNYTTRQEFCSMKCVRDWLLNFPYNKEKVEFITLPYVQNFEQLKELLVDVVKK